MTNPAHSEGKMSKAGSQMLARQSAYYEQQAEALDKFIGTAQQANRLIGQIMIDALTTPKESE